MATYSKLKLSGSTDGNGIKVVQTASAGDTIHTAVAGTSDLDEVWLYAVNNHTASVALTIQYGGTTAVDNDITISVPAKAGLFLVVPGLVINNGGVIKAFAASANVVVIYGFVNRIAA